MAITVSLATSRVTGVAPLSVHFNATGTTSTVTTRPFHELTFDWDMDDNLRHASSAVAAHVYRTPGTYTVRLLVAEPDGSFVTQNVVITVTDPDVVFAGTKTICFSNTADFTGAPAGATQVTTSSFNTVMSYYATDRRLLMKRGDSFLQTSGVTCAGTGAPVSIGAFGTGTNPDVRGIFDNNPIVQVQTDDSVVQIGNGGSTIECDDLRFVDVEFDYINGGTPGKLFNLSYRGDDLLFSHIRASEFSQCYGFGHETPDFFAVDICHGVCIANCDHPGGTQYGAYFSARDGAILNCNFADITTEHLLRFPFGERVVVSGCNLANAQADKLSIKLHSKSHVDATTTSRHYVIQGNYFTHRTAWCMAFGSASSGQDNRVEDVIVERNDLEVLHRDNAYPTPIQVNNDGCTIRNNRFIVNDSTNLLEIQWVRVDQIGAGTPNPRDVVFYHNTLHTTEVLANTRMIHVAASDTSVLVRNNLLYCPNATSTSVSGGSPVTASNNLEDVDPLFVSATDWNLQATSPAIGYGTPVPVLDDYDAIGHDIRDLVAPDAGAFEYSVGGGGGPAPGGRRQTRMTSGLGIGV